MNYLGDSVYAEFDGYSIILTTNNGYPDDPRNEIILEDAVYQNLTKFAAECFRHIEPVAPYVKETRE